MGAFEGLAAGFAQMARSVYDQVVLAATTPSEPSQDAHPAGPVGLFSAQTAEDFPFPGPGLGCGVLGEADPSRPYVYVGQDHPGASLDGWL